MEKKEKNRSVQQVNTNVVQPEKNRPVHEVKLPFSGGLLVASIWRHQSDQDHSRFSVSFSRAYKDSASGKWVYGEYFSRDELLGLVRVIEVAHGHIVTGIIDGGNTNE